MPVQLYEDDPGRHRLTELTESLGQVELAIRQLVRAQTAHRAEQSKRAEVGFVDGNPTQDLMALEIERSDQMEFAIIAARRAVRAHYYLSSKRNLPLPEFRQQEKIWALRDLYEHWNEWRVEERESFANDNRWLAATSAGPRWAKASGGRRPIGEMTMTAAAPPDFFDPEGRITVWNSIDIDQLTADLETLRAAIQEHRERAFEWELLDQSAAIELVGPTMWTLIATFTDVRGRRALDGVVRWERALLLAADRAIREQRWIIDGQVVGPRGEHDVDRG